MTRAGEKKRIGNATLGLLLAVVLAIGAWLAFTKSVPFTGGTEYKVAFGSAQNLRPDSPVRIAGVEVGKVKSVEPLGPQSEELAASETGDGEPVTNTGALATLELNDEGLPLKEDATFKLRPRLFLEGNLFVDVFPGSPAAAVADPDRAFPPTQTSNTVQLGEILTGSFQRDSRRDLQTLLDEFGTALIDEGGAESFRVLYRTSKGNFKNTALVAEAFLGENPRDLSNLIRNLDKVVRGLGANERALQDTVTNLRIVTGSLAAEGANLEAAVAELPRVLDAADPAFANLNAAFPPLRAFAREALPGVESTPRTLDAATPLLNQIRLLARPQELRGLARDLVPAVPNLARLSARTPGFLEQARALASCFNQVIIPWSTDEVEPGAGYPHPVVGPVYKETAYGLTGIAGESRSGDANGQYIRVLAGGGTNTVSVTAASGEQFAGVTQFPIQGTMPATDSSAKTPFRPNAPCENQQTPDLRAGVGPGPTNTSAPADAVPTRGTAADALEDSTEVLHGLTEAVELREEGERREARETRTEALKKLRRYYREYGG